MSGCWVLVDLLYWALSFFEPLFIDYVKKDIWQLSNLKKPIGIHTCWHIDHGICLCPSTIPNLFYIISFSSTRRQRQQSQEINSWTWTAIRLIVTVALQCITIYQLNETEVNAHVVRLDSIVPGILSACKQFIIRSTELQKKCFAWMYYQVSLL